MPRIFRAILHLTALLVAVFWALRAPADTIDTYIRSEMTDQHLPGLALAVIRDGKPLKVKTYGLANLELSAPVMPDTVFRIASLSKQMIATAAMLLIQDGKLRLDEPVCRYLEDCPDAWRAITLAQVLSHTSGLANEAPGNNPFKLESDVEVIRRAYSVPLKSKPGEKWLYSNLGYSVVAEVIHQAGGEPWPQFVAKRIFDPLGMTKTRTTSSTDLVPNRAAGYQFRDDRQSNVLPLVAVRPSGAFLSTLSDLIKWDAAITSGKLLKPALQNEMWSAHTLPDGSSTHYGFGWWIDEVAGHPRIRHGGSQPGFRSEYSRFVNEHLNVIVLANGESVRPDDVALEVANQYIRGLVTDRKAIQLSRAELAPYAGRYQVSPSSILTVGVDGSGLSIQSSDCCAQFHLRAETPSVFFLSKDESYTFTREGDHVKQLEVRLGTAASVGASELKASRIP